MRNLSWKYTRKSRIEFNFIKTRVNPLFLNLNYIFQIKITASLIMQLMQQNISNIFKFETNDNKIPKWKTK